MWHRSLATNRRSRTWNWQKLNLLKTNKETGKNEKKRIHLFQHESIKHKTIAKIRPETKRIQIRTSQKYWNT